MFRNIDNNQTIKRRLLLLGAIAAALILSLAGGFLLIDALRGEPSPRYVEETSSIVATAPSRSDVAGAAATATSVPAAVTRLQIPRIGVDAGIVTLGVDPDGTMQAPATATDVAWYRFSARPGQPGNVVMAGHVNYIGYGPAVFARLTELRPGDEIVLETETGRRFAYHVLTVTAHEDRPDEVARAVGPTDAEVVTLITCTGTFDRATGLYDRRLVVRAERS